VAEPLSVADSLFGVPATSLPRVARLVDGNWPAALAARADDALCFRAATRAMQPTALFGNQPEYLTLDIPSPGAITAAAVARMYAALIGAVDGVRLITPDRLTRISAVVTADADPVLGAPVPKGLGYFLGLPEMGPHAGVFGSKGSGGSIAFAGAGHGFAFTHNRLTAPPHDSAAQVRQALGIGP
jgi:hypothetical protein